MFPVFLKFQENVAHGVNSVKLKARVPYLRVFENCLHTFRPMSRKCIKIFTNQGFLLLISRNIRYGFTFKTYITTGGAMKSNSLKELFHKFKALTLAQVSKTHGCSIRTVQRQFAELAVLKCIYSYNNVFMLLNHRCSFILKNWNNSKKSGHFASFIPSFFFPKNFFLNAP